MYSEIYTELISLAKNFKTNKIDKKQYKIQCNNLWNKISNSFFGQKFSNYAEIIQNGLEKHICFYEQYLPNLSEIENILSHSNDRDKDIVRIIFSIWKKW